VAEQLPQRRPVRVGVQVEDAVEITTGGVRRLTQSSQELAIVG